MSEASTPTSTATGAEADPRSASSDLPERCTESTDLTPGGLATAWGRCIREYGHEGSHWRYSHSDTGESFAAVHLGAPSSEPDPLPPNMVREVVTVTDGRGRRVESRVRYRTIHELLGLILAELPAIGRTSEAPQAIGGFKFRGIEAVKDALNPLLAKYGVFYVPDVQSRTTEEKRGREHATTLHVRFTWYGPAGDSVTGSVWSEGMDTRDKGHQKAMTSAEKYWLVQSLAIATNEQGADDLDASAGPGADPPASDAELHAVLNKLRPVMDAHGGYPEAWKAQPAGADTPGTYRLQTLEQMLAGEKDRCLHSDVQAMLGILDDVQPPTPAEGSSSPDTEGQPAQNDAPGEVETNPDNPPCELCGSTRAERVTVKGVWRCANPKDCERRTEKREQERAEMAAASDAPFTDDGEAEARLREAETE